MWILILTIIIGANNNATTAISTVPVTFNDYIMFVWTLESSGRLT